MVHVCRINELNLWFRQVAALEAALTAEGISDSKVGSQPRLQSHSLLFCSGSQPHSFCASLTHFSVLKVRQRFNPFSPRVHRCLLPHASRHPPRFAPHLTRVRSGVSPQAASIKMDIGKLRSSAVAEIDARVSELSEVHLTSSRM